jgi:2-amino-4-hydroxy-6-hydroxymethyldihydropteridine diphosphokinase
VNAAADSRISHQSAAEHQAYIGLGSNIAPVEHLPRALCLLGEYTTVLACSQAWETPPYGMAGDNFLNAVVQVQTPLAANSLKSMVLRRIEAMLGRVRTHEKFIPRTIDLDILVFDGQVLDTDVWTQSHWAVPLAELFPALVDEPGGTRLDEVARRLQASAPQMRARPGVITPGKEQKWDADCRG